jgi:hypothetical protein
MHGNNYTFFIFGIFPIAFTGKKSAFNRKSSDTPYNMDDNPRAYSIPALSIATQFERIRRSSGIAVSQYEGLLVLEIRH